MHGTVVPGNLIKSNDWAMEFQSACVMACCRWHEKHSMWAEIWCYLNAEKYISNAKQDAHWIITWKQLNDVKSANCCKIIQDNYVCGGMTMQCNDAYIYLHGIHRYLFRVPTLHMHTPKILPLLLFPANHHWMIFNRFQDSLQCEIDH